MAIVKVEFKSQEEELFWLGKKIKSLLENKVEAEEIAVIARTHKNLQKLISYLEFHKLGYNYQKGQDVLDTPFIQDLILLAKFVYALSEPSIFSEEYLPEILTWECWQLDSLEVWKLSLKAYQKNKPWLDLMLESKDEKYLKLANFFVEISQKSKHLSLTHILDILVEPLKKTYFQKTDLDSQQIQNLSSLKTFLEAVQKYKSKQTTRLEDLIEYLQIVETNQLQIIDRSPFGQGEKRVNLLTAHKAKGLEFEHVFLISLTKDNWQPKKKSSRLSLPINYPILPQNDNTDDQLRLLFVALTRAKNNLYLSRFSEDSKGKTTRPIEFLKSDGWETINLEEDFRESILSINIAPDNFQISTDKKDLLRNELTNYQLNVTALNNFLDLTKGGPIYFLEQNLLHFPQSKSVSASYGTAMHGAIRDFYSEFKATKSLPEINFLEKVFLEHLAKQRLNTDDYKDYSQRGKKSLRAYYRSKQDSFDPEEILEFSFKNQGVMLEGANLGGQIDKILVDPETNLVQVTDFKTGKALNSWKADNLFNRIKLWKYKNQLLFYKLLVENSRHFSPKYKVNLGYLDFLEPQSDTQEIVSLKLDLAEFDITNFRNLIINVYNRIINLDFPKTSSFTADLSGIQEFCDYLVSS